MFGSLRRSAFAHVQRMSQLASLPNSGAAAVRLMSHKGVSKGVQAPQLSNKDRTAMLRAAAALHVPPTPASGSNALAASAAPASAPAAPGPATHEGTRRDFAGIAAMLTAVLGLITLLAGSRSSTSFRERRVAAVKDRLKSAAKATPQERAAKSSDEPALPLFPRASAMAVVDIIVRTAGLYMLCSPKGEGKTSLMTLLAQKYPLVIRVDLQNGSQDKAVRAVAAAIGYSLQYTAGEMAAKGAGFPVPEIKALQGAAELEELLLVFEQACNELRKEGVLGSHVPVLILDHANRPEPPCGDPKESIIYKLVEIGHRIANDGTASWVAVTSDPQQEHEAWTKAGGRDSLKPIRVPPFTKVEAHELLARRIFTHSNASMLPSAEQLSKIQNDYASTLDFVCGAVGMRARWLSNALDDRPFSDAELKGEGVNAVPKGVRVDSDPAYYGCLPDELRDPKLRVDPRVWDKFKAMVSKRKGALKPVLEVPSNFALLPRLPPPTSPEDLLASRVLSVDATLRDLLKARGSKAAVQTDPAAAAEASATGLPYEALRDKYFEGHNADLRQLCAEHVLFFDHAKGTLEFESALMQRIAASWLEEPRHKYRVQLLRKLLEWQKAKGQQADAGSLFALRKGAGTDKAATQALAAAGTELAAAQATVKQLDAEVEALRKQLHLLPHD